MLWEASNVELVMKSPSFRYLNITIDATRNDYWVFFFTHCKNCFRKITLGYYSYVVIFTMFSEKVTTTACTTNDNGTPDESGASLTYIRCSVVKTRRIAVVCTCIQHGWTVS